MRECSGQRRRRRRLLLRGVCRAIDITQAGSSVRQLFEGGEQESDAQFPKKITYIVVNRPHIQNARRQGILETRPSRNLYQTLCEEGPDSQRVVTPRPPTIRRIKHHRIQPRYPHIAQIFSLQPLRIAHRLRAELLSKGIDPAQVTQVERRTQHMDARNGVLPAIVDVAAAASGAREQGFGRLGRSGCVFA